MTRRVVALLGLLAALATACLRPAAVNADHHIGYAIDPAQLADHGTYGLIVAFDATILTPENHMKWGLIHPGPDHYDFAAADAIVARAAAHGQTVRGHVLVWHNQLPSWVDDGEWTREELIDVMRDHIHTVVGHFATEFPGVVTQWDVVNEAFYPDGSRRSTIFQDIIGDDYIELAFRFAHEADPTAELFYNDYYDDFMLAGETAFEGAPAGDGATATRTACADVPKCVATRDLVDELLAAGAPIHGVGFQAHLFTTAPTDYGELAAWTADRTIEWAITELDVALLAGTDTPANLAAQADAMASVVGDCVDAPNCDTTVFWGVSDADSWIPPFTGGIFDHGLLYDHDYAPKPALTAIRDVLVAAG